MPNGILENDYRNSHWITSAPLNATNYQFKDENCDYVSVTWKNRTVSLTSAIIQDSDHVVTGVRFRRQDGHIRVEIRATRYDFDTGVLLDLDQSFWIGNDNVLSERTLTRPDLPTKSLVKSKMFPDNNEFVKFQPSDINKDGAQSIVPYLDATAVRAYVPLSGVGLYYKSTPGYGGFIAPKLTLIDFGPIRKKRTRYW